MNTLQNVIVSKKSFDSDDKYDIIYSNITVVNLILDEGGSYGQITDESLCSYFVDYYSSQVANGNFSQFVYNSGWNETMNEIIKTGLSKMNANKHLELFEKQSNIVNSLPQDELEAYFNSEYFGENATRDKLKCDEFFDIPEDLTDLNSQWLRNLPNLKVLDFEEMFTKLETLLGKKISR